MSKQNLVSGNSGHSIVNNVEDDDEEKLDAPKLLPAGMELDTEVDEAIQKRTYEDDYVDKNGNPLLLPNGMKPCNGCDD